MTGHGVVRPIYGPGHYFDFGAGSFTVELVVRYNATEASTQGLIAKGGDAARWAFVRYGNSFQLNLTDGTHGFFPTGGTSYNDGQWHHMAMVVDRTAKTLSGYVDGVSAVTAADITTFTNADTAVAVTVGSLKSTANSLFKSNTDIAEIRVSNIARDPATFPSAIAGPSTTIWQATVATQPNIVAFNDVVGTKVANVAACTAAGDWFWGANVLSIYSASNPATLYTSPGIEVAYRDACVTNNATAVNNVTLLNLCLKHGNNVNLGNVFLEGGPAANWTVSGCTLRDGAGGGALISGVTGGGHKITLCTITGNCGQGGLFTYLDTGSTATTQSVASYNTVTANAQYGVEIRGNYWILENNIITGNGTGLNATKGVGGIGLHIYCGASGEGTGQYNIIRDNAVTNQYCQTGVDGSGIGVDQWCTNNTVCRNSVTGCDGNGVEVYDATYTVLYNNACYGNGQDRGASHGAPNRNEIALLGSLTNNTTLANNIGYATAASAYAIYLDSNAAASTLSITNNCWYRVSGNWYYDGSVGGATLATWNAKSYVGTDINADPLFTNPSGSDFSLQATSPCKNAGTPIAGVTTKNPPDMGAYPDAA